MDGVAEIIEAQLTLTNQRGPEPDIVSTWLIDLQRRSPFPPIRTAPTPATRATR